MAEQIFHAHITGLAVGGEAIGTVVSGGPSIEGKRVFLDHGIPGETVTFEVSEQKGSFLRGSVREVSSSSIHRVLPPCLHFGKCGGCDYQYIEPNALRAAKKNMIQSMLRHQAKIDVEVETCGTNLPHYDYRRRAALQVSHRHGKIEIGFFRKKSGDVQNIDSCALLRPLLKATLQKLLSHRHLIPSKVTKIVMEEYLDRSYLELKISLLPHESKQNQEAAAFQAFLALFPRVKISCDERVWFANYTEDTTFALGHFSQVNEEGNQLLQSTVVSLVRESEVSDLYAGAGNLSFPLVAAGKKVTAVEVNPILVRNGESRAARENHSDRITFVEASCEQYCRDTRITGAVLLDPPRSGAAAVVESLSASQVNEIIYVSCSLPTLTRDLKVLVSKGFKVARVLFVDMFPQTHHVETITYLHPKEARQ